ncbi:MAG: hypothetical protein KG075_17615 [Alphaproteobacteria bacterium]|nr:hypothetical protein [Alphaproteobacteria bacterium]
MAENDGNDLVVRIGGDATGFDKAADSAVKKLDELEKKVVAGTQEIDKRTDALSATEKKYAEQLKTRYDPVYAAQKRYIAELANIDRAVKLNALNEDAATAAFQRALADRTAAIQRATRLNGTFAASNDAMAASGRRAGSIMQQAGFQIGDFAVQVASGSGFLRPFIQQGTQLVSAFGPWGAAIGAVGAVVGALATTFLDLSEKTSDTDKATKVYEETLKSLQAVIDELDKKGKDRLDLLKAERDNAMQLVRVEMAKTQALIDQARVRAELAALSDPETAFGVGNAELARIQVLDKQIADRRTQIEALEERFMAASNAVYNDKQAEQAKKDAKERTRIESEVEKEAERRRKMIQQADTDAAAQQDKDRMAAMKRGADIIKQDEERARKFEAYLSGLEAENKLLGVSSEERRLQNALIEAQQQKGSALNDVERQRIETAQRVGEAFRQQKAAADEIERSFERAFDRIGAAVTTMVVEGKASALDFRNIWLAVVGEIAQEFIKLAAINPLKNAIFGTTSAALGFDFFGLLGGGGSAGSSAGIDYGSYGQTGIGYVGPSAFHTGGVVGTDPGRPRTVANDTFVGAPRFHSGLMPDEFPAILQKGEGVFTKAQMAAMGGASVQIIDQRTNAPPIERQQMSDGTVRLIVRDEISRAAPTIAEASAALVADKVARGGQYAAAFRS